MKKSLVYGPVPSRRLGLSLGVDVVPYKACPFDCIYCQIGRTPETSVERRGYVPTDRVLKELEERLSSGIRADHITLGGSGEPTLNREIGEIIRKIKTITEIPVAVLTNGALLDKPEVRAALSAADVVLPSLDAPDESVYQRVNRPHSSISFAALVQGLIRFRQEYSGQIWLEIFFVNGFNTAESHLETFRKLVERMSPEKVHLNTAVRPTAEDYADLVPEEILLSFAQRLGNRAEVIAEFPRAEQQGAHRGFIDQELLDMLSRRPCTLQDIASGLNISESDLMPHLQSLLADKHICRRQSGANTYYFMAEDSEKTPER